MEDKQSKQMERFSVMANSSDFLSFDDKSKQRCKIKTNYMQGYGPYQIKKTFRRYFSKFPPVQ